ncbi:MAG: hypothetical protein JWR69_416 [Pedosphaera sp.]|nr:hypothetical protein [Pedosphaera sp.]
MDKYTLDGRHAFKSSGKVNWVRFIPWAALAWIVSVGLAMLLYFLFTWGFYFVLLIPLLVSLGVAGMVLLAVQKGHCRSRLVASLLGLATGMTLYLGYYYAGMVDALGIESVARVELLPSYIAFRMQTDVIRHEHSPKRDRDEATTTGSHGMNWFMFAAEFCCIIGISCAGGFRRAGKPYCEKCQGWMNRETTKFKPEIGPAFAEALRLGAVQSLAALFTSPPKSTAPYTAVALDYCPSLKSGKTKDCTVYMSVKQITENPKGATLDAFDGAKGKLLLRQIRIKPDELAALLPRFSVLETVTETTAAEALRELRVEAPVQTMVRADIWPVDPLYAGKVLTTKTKLIAVGFMLGLVLTIFGSIGLGFLGGYFAFPDHLPAGGVSPALKLLGEALIGIAILLAVADLILILTAPDFFATRHLLRLIKREFARRPERLVNPGDSEVHFVQIIPRANWGKLKLDDASDVGFLRLDLKYREILFEGDKEYFRIPTAAITSCEVERFVVGEGSHGATTFYRLVLEVNDSSGSREVPIGPRGGSGKFRAQKREKWARDMERRIKAMMAEPVVARV